MFQNLRIITFPLIHSTLYFVKFAFLASTNFIINRTKQLILLPIIFINHIIFISSSAIKTI